MLYEVITLIAAKKPQMLVYGLIDGIVLDETKRDEWWHVSMHILSLVITSYSIHYTKLYDYLKRAAPHKFFHDKYLLGLSAGEIHLVLLS